LFPKIVLSNSNILLGFYHGFQEEQLEGGWVGSIEINAVVFSLRSVGAREVLRSYKTFNKTRKENIDLEISHFASNDLIIQDTDITYICEQAFLKPNICTTIITSYQQVGIHFFN